MKNIKLVNKIAKVGTDVFDKTKYVLSTDTETPEAIMVRSTSLHGIEFPKSLLAVARAGAGVNNIPVEEMAEQGVVVFNTPGANANGVKELAIAALILASRDISGGIRFAESLRGNPDAAKEVEAGKSKFAGHEILGKTLGVIGLGAIGGMVANAARHLGMTVIGCDPFITVNAAWSLSNAVKHAQNYDEIYQNADYITLHIPATKDTRGIINAETIAKMKDGVRIINLARADLVNSEDMKAALESGKVASYVTDFPTPESLQMKNTVNIPHLGASTEESEDNCAVMAARELVDYLEKGNIKNSVNYPTVSLPASDLSRICVFHRNVANMISQITSAISSEKINIENMANGSKGNYAYTIIETTEPVGDEICKKIAAVEGIIRVREIKD